MAYAWRLYRNIFLSCEQGLRENERLCFQLGNFIDMLIKPPHSFLIGWHQIVNTLCDATPSWCSHTPTHKTAG